MIPFEKKISERLSFLKQNQSFRTPIDFDSTANSITINDKKVLNFSSNDYLALSEDTKLQDAFLSSLQKEGYLFGATSSRYISGGSSSHLLLEETLGELYKKEACLFSSGYHANLGIIHALALEETEFFLDSLCHASIIDGVRLSKAPFSRFPHNDITQLEALLRKSTAKNKLVISESVFSMDGDVCPLSSIIALKKKYPFLLYLDTAHGIGAYGQPLLGIPDEVDLEDIDIIVGAFGKAYGTIGGFAIGTKDIIRFINNFSRSSIFSTALPPFVVKWVLFLLENRKKLYKKQEQVQKKALSFSSLLGKLDPASAPETPVFPIVVGNNEKALALSKKALGEGFYIPGIRPPTVPVSQSRLRISINCDTSESALKKLSEFLHSSLSK